MRSLLVLMVRRIRLCSGSNHHPERVPPSTGRVEGSPQMLNYTISIIAILLALQSGCTTTTSSILTNGKMEKSASTLKIEKVGVSPKTVWIDKGESTEIRWEQNRQVQTTVKILSEKGQPVRKFKNIYPAGECLVVWDGRDENGNSVGGGVYRYVLYAVDQKGNEAHYDPALTTGGEELNVERFSFDREKKELKFILPRASRARIRIGLSPSPYLRTLLDWEPMEAGSHTLVWDGLDESAWIKAINHPDLSVNLSAFALADNAIIAKGEKGGVDLPQQKPNQLRNIDRNLYFHAAHERDHCRDITFDIEFPNVERNPEGLPILKDETIVRVRLRSQDRNFMVNQRFEVMFFVDTVFLFEEEEGQDPFNFAWDTKGLNPGEHLLTVNLIGYEDHLGVKTVRVIKEEKP